LRREIGNGENRGFPGYFMTFPVAITARSFDSGPALAELLRHAAVVYRNTGGKRLAGQELSAALRGATGAIAGTEPYSSEILEAAPGLRVISRIGSGTDNIDASTAGRLGIRVLNTPEAPVQAVAEHTLALALALARDLGAYQRELPRGRWEARAGTLLSGKTVGIIGMGRIGQRVARLFQAFGCGIVYYDPHTSSGPDPGWRRCPSLGDLLGAADVITLHAPAQEGNAPLLSGEALQLCRKGAFLINTARGSLVDGDALLRALDEGRIAGAGLDVFPWEPYEGPLLTHEKVVATPHVASNTRETRSRMEMEAVENIVRALGGGGP
jgi:D-3-phosphoglycerate dehydrogenase